MYTESARRNDRVPYEVSLTPKAMEMLTTIPDRRIQGELVKRAERLAEEPEKQGSALVGDLAGFRAVRAVGQRYRIVYRVDSGQVVVMVVGLGIRKDGDRRDVYQLMRRLVRLGILEP